MSTNIITNDNYYRKTHKLQDELINLYGCRCLLTGIETNNLTKHHIIKKEDDGPSTIENPALLVNEIHK